MLDYLCMCSHMSLFLLGQHKTKETIKRQRKISHLGGFKVNRRESLRGSKEIHGSLLCLLLSENIPEKGHGVNDSRQLLQNGILGIFQTGGITYSRGLKMKMNSETWLPCASEPGPSFKGERLWV